MRHKATRIAFVCMGTALRSGPRLAGDLLKPSVRNSFSISCALNGGLVAASPIRRDRDTTGENVLTGRPIRAPVQRRPLGRTGLDVSEIGFGAWAIGGDAHGNSYGPTKDTECIQAVRRAGDLRANL